MANSESTITYSVEKLRDLYEQAKSLPDGTVKKQILVCKHVAAGKAPEHVMGDSRGGPNCNVCAECAELLFSGSVADEEVLTLMPDYWMRLPNGDVFWMNPNSADGSFCPDMEKMKEPELLT